MSALTWTSRGEEERRQPEWPHLECGARRRMVPVAAPGLRTGIIFRIEAAPAQGLRRRRREAGPEFRRPGTVPARALLATGDRSPGDPIARIAVRSEPLAFASSPASAEPVDSVLVPLGHPHEHRLSRGPVARAGRFSPIATSACCSAAARFPRSAISSRWWHCHGWC